jgi:hypothetical protein
MAELQRELTAKILTGHGGRWMFESDPAGSGDRAGDGRLTASAVRYRAVGWSEYARCR